MFFDMVGTDMVRNRIGDRSPLSFTLMPNDLFQSGKIDDADRLLRRGLYLEYVTLAWNVAGTAILVLAAIKSHSVSLAGFGVDSFIEIGASAMVVWELKGTGREHRARAMRMIGAAFIALAVYILIQSACALYLHARPHTSPLGIGWVAVTFAAMVLLATGKARVGRLLNNPVLLSESRVTMIDAYLAASVLIGLLLNAMLGWWWADASGALIIVAYGLIEGRHALAEASTLDLA